MMSNTNKLTFELLVNVRRLKLTGPLHKSSSTIYIRFNKEKQIKVPDDSTNERLTGPSVVNFTNQKSSCGFYLTLAESTNKLLVELMTP